MLMFRVYVWVSVDNSTLHVSSMKMSLLLLQFSMQIAQRRFTQPSLQVRFFNHTFSKRTCVSKCCVSESSVQFIFLNVYCLRDMPGRAVISFGFTRNLHHSIPLMLLFLFHQGTLIILQSTTSHVSICQVGLQNFTSDRVSDEPYLRSMMITPTTPLNTLIHGREIIRCAFLWYLCYCNSMCIISLYKSVCTRVHLYTNPITAKTGPLLYTITFRR